MKLCKTQVHLQAKLSYFLHLHASESMRTTVVDTHYDGGLSRFMWWYFLHVYRSSKKKPQNPQQYTKYTTTVVRIDPLAWPTSEMGDRVVVPWYQRGGTWYQIFKKGGTWYLYKFKFMNILFDTVVYFDQNWDYVILLPSIWVEPDTKTCGTKPNLVPWATCNSTVHIRLWYRPCLFAIWSALSIRNLIGWSINRNFKWRHSFFNISHQNRPKTM